MLQANRLDSSNISPSVPPSLSEEAIDEFGQITYAFLSKHLKPEEILSVEVVIQWNPQGKRERIVTEEIVGTQMVQSMTPRANKKGDIRPKVPNTNCYWGPDQGCR